MAKPAFPGKSRIFIKYNFFTVLAGFEGPGSSKSSPACRKTQIWTNFQLRSSILPKFRQDQSFFTDVHVFFNVFAMLAKLHTRSNLTSILEPRCPPNPQLGSKMAPSCKQNAAKTLQVGAKMAPRPPSWSQDGPKTPQLGAALGISPNLFEHYNINTITIR